MVREEGTWCDKDHGIVPEPKEFPVESRFLSNLQNVQDLKATKTTNFYVGKTKCKKCDKYYQNGLYKYNDWAWPIAYFHYLKEHCIHPSNDFMNFIDEMNGDRTRQKQKHKESRAQKKLASLYIPKGPPVDPVFVAKLRKIESKTPRIFCPRVDKCDICGDRVHSDVYQFKGNWERNEISWPESYSSHYIDEHHTQPTDELRQFITELNSDYEFDSDSGDYFDEFS